MACRLKYLFALSVININMNFVFKILLRVLTVISLELISLIATYCLSTLRYLHLLLRIITLDNKTPVQTLSKYGLTVLITSFSCKQRYVILSFIIITTIIIIVKT